MTRFLRLLYNISSCNQHYSVGKHRPEKCLRELLPNRGAPDEAQPLLLLPLLAHTTSCVCSPQFYNTYKVATCVRDWTQALG